MGAELTLALCMSAAFVIWCERFGGRTYVMPVLSNNRAALYGALMSLFGALLGFVIATISIVLGFATHEQFSVLRKSVHYRTLWAVFASAARFLGLATIAALAALLADRDAAPHVTLFYACAVLSLICVARTARCVWALEAVVRIATSEPRV